MTIKVLVNGAFGKMGQLVTQAVTEHKGLELVGQTGREYDLQKSIKDSGADVVIDLTTAESVFTNAAAIIEAGARPVIGTSGLSAADVKKLSAECARKKLGGIVVPNFSIGGVLMMKCAQDIAKYMPNVEIIEMHHNNKKDSPSGTAVRSAELLGKAVSHLNKNTHASHETLKGARGASLHNIPIHSIRLPGLLAHQAIIFGEPGETLTIRHDTIDRQSFMPGVCLACEKVMELDHMVYGLEEIL